MCPVEAQPVAEDPAEGGAGADRCLTDGPVVPARSRADPLPLSRPQAVLGSPWINHTGQLPWGEEGLEAESDPEA